MEDLLSLLFFKSIVLSLRILFGLAPTLSRLYHPRWWHRVFVSCIVSFTAHPLKICLLCRLVITRNSLINAKIYTNESTSVLLDVNLASAIYSESVTPDTLYMFCSPCLVQSFILLDLSLLAPSPQQSETQTCCIAQQTYMYVFLHLPCMESFVCHKIP